MFQGVCLKILRLNGRNGENGSSKPFRDEKRTRSEKRHHSDGISTRNVGSFDHHHMVHVWNIYLPRTQMTPVLIGKGLVLGGLTFKNRGHWGSRYIYHKFKANISKYSIHSTLLTTTKRPTKCQKANTQAAKAMSC